jgi:rhodanese-related sulfurtransferase
LSTAELQAMLSQDGKSVFLLDVRTSGEWARGRIPGSVHIPMDQIPRRLQEIPRDKKIVAVCASGARSEAVARYLDQQGFPWVANYRDGVFGWSRGGLELER